MFIAEGIVTKVRRIKSKTKYVYDLTTKNNNYFANRVLVHNSDLLIDAYTGSRIVDISASDLIKLGYLSPTKFLLVPFSVLKSEESYINSYEQFIVENRIRNELITNITNRIYSQNKSCLIAVTRIEHGKTLEKMIRPYIPEVVFTYGKIDSPERKEVLDKLERKELRCVIATTVFGEGVDIPSLDVVICAKAQDSVVNALQLAGRVMRLSPGKKCAYVVDICDYGNKYFSDHTKNRISAYKREPEFQLIKCEDPVNFDFV